MPGKRVQMNRLLDIPHHDVLLSYSNIIIHVGVNDLRNDTVNIMNLIHRLRDICTHLCRRKRGLNIVLSCAMPTRNRFLNQRSHEFNYQLYILSQMLNNVSFLNNNVLAGHDACLDSKYARGVDVHINGRGYTALAMAMRDHVLIISNCNGRLHR